MNKELLGVDTITNILDDFLDEFGATSRLGVEFGYLERKNLIEYAVAIEPVSDGAFMANFHRLAPEINCDTFLISFLHELGHHMTMPDLTEEDYWYCVDTVDVLEEEITTPGLPKERIMEIHQQYYDLPIERMATDWAIEYIFDNVEKVAALWNRLQPAIMEFYRLNEVEGAC